MTIVAVCAAGGSSGSTTTSLLLAALSRRPPLLLECDPEGGDVAGVVPVVGVTVVDVGGGRQ